MSEHNRPSSTSQNINMINCWRQLVSRDGYENLILLGCHVKLHIAFNEYVYNNTFPRKKIKNWPFVVFLDGWNPRFRLHISPAPSAILNIGSSLLGFNTTWHGYSSAWFSNVFTQAWFLPDHTRSVTWEPRVGANHSWDLKGVVLIKGS